MKKFLRRTSNRYSKLGRKRKKKQKWRKPTGRDNKMREKRKGYPKTVNIGYKKPEKEKPILVNNISDLEKVKSKNVIIRKVGRKKRIEIAKKAKEMNLQISNFNAERLLKKFEKINKNQNKKWT